MMLRMLNKNEFVLVVINALLVGSIVFFSVLVSGGQNYMAVLPGAIFGGLLKLLITLQIAVEHEINEENATAKKRKPKKVRSILHGLMF